MICRDPWPWVKLKSRGNRGDAAGHLATVGPNLITQSRFPALSTHGLEWPRVTFANPWRGLRSQVDYS
jgi:hypothetical protein